MAAPSLFEALQARIPALRQTPVDGGVQVIAVLFPEELGHRKEGCGWTFIIRRTIMQRRGAQTETAFVRAGRAGAEDLAARLPEFRLLQTSVAAVFGLGCVGAPSAMEMARAGLGGLHCLDHDRVEPGTVVRWAFGFSAAGLKKVDVIRDVVVRDYPWVQVETSSARIGAAGQLPSERDEIERMLDGANIIYDATAEPGVQQVLSDEARDRQLP